MAAFTTGYTDILPDPNNKIGDAGETSTSGTGTLILWACLLKCQPDSRLSQL